MQKEETGYLDCGDDYLSCGDDYLSCGDDYLSCGDDEMPPVIPGNESPESHPPYYQPPRKDNFLVELFYSIIVAINRWFSKLFGKY